MRNFYVLGKIALALLVAGGVLYLPSLKKRARQRNKMAIIILNVFMFIFSAIMFWFSGFQLYKWYSVGKLTYASRFIHGPAFYISYDQNPTAFTFMAIFFSFSFIFFALCILAMLGRYGITYYPRYRRRSDSSNAP
ncbi:MAG: hypothetical protein WBW35_21795 [Xanthobacteraceae bacterium]